MERSHLKEKLLVLHEHTQVHVHTRFPLVIFVKTSAQILPPLQQCQDHSFT